MLTEDEKRRLFKAHYREREKICRMCDKLMEEWDAAIAQKHFVRIPMPELPRYPPLTEECIDLICGARTRKNTPCKRKDLYSTGATGCTASYPPNR